MLKDLTIGIKTFCRPKVLEWNLKQWSNIEIFKDLSVIIADDSDDKNKIENKNIISKGNNKNIMYLDLSFNTGLSFGRNQIVENCITEYIMIIDDSRSFNLNTNIFEMIHFLKKYDNYSIIAGYVNVRENINSHYSGIITKYEKKNNIEYYEIDTLTKKQKIENGIYETHSFLNTFIARTRILKKHNWNNNLKMKEHSRWLFDLFKNDIKCAITFKCNFIQANNQLRNYGKYIKYRNQGINNTCIINRKNAKQNLKLLNDLLICE